MRTAIYTRISHDPTGESLGVERQLDDCLALADSLGWDVVTRFDDNDISAYSGKVRPGFEALLDAIKRSEIDAVICWHTDRLYRSLKDLVRLLDVAAGVHIKTVRGGDLDLSTPTGRMLATILGGVAVQESEHKGERQRRANDQKAAAGKWQTANRPFGYTMTGEPLEPEASMVKQAVADVLAGKSINAVAREWNAAEVPTTLGTTWKSSRVRRLLVSPRYAALKVHRGKVVGPGAWEPLIDEDTHKGLVAFVSDPARVTCTSYEKKYQGSGIYRCGRCGGLMRHAVAGNPRVRRYECIEHQHVTRRGEPLDEYISTLVVRRLSAADGVVLDDTDKTNVSELHTQRTGLQARLDELAGLFAEGAIDGSQLRRGTSELRAKLAGIDGQLAELAKRSPVAELLTAGGDLALRWDALSADLRGKVINELMTVTALPAPRGRNVFDPAYIDVAWKV